MVENSYIIISKSLRNKRIELNLSQEEMANLISVSVATLKKIENIKKSGKYIPSNNTLKKIKKYVDSDSKKEINQLLVRDTKVEKESKTEKQLILKLQNEILSEVKKIILKIEPTIKLDEDIKIVNSLKNDYETTNKIIQLVWKFNLEITKYFSELNLLLATNDVNSNKKLKKGILEISNNLKKMGIELQKYLNDDEDTIDI